MNELNFSKELHCFKQANISNELNCQEVDAVTPCCEEDSCSGRNNCCYNPCEACEKILTPDTAFDGCFYYKLVCGKAMIAKTGACLKEPQNIATKREYRCITYDKTENCFWAVAKRCPHFIFKLNKCLQEIGHIEPCYPCCKGCDIVGISYDTITNCLMLCTHNILMKLAKGSSKPSVIVCEDTTEQDCSHSCDKKCRCCKCGCCCDECYCENCRCEHCHGDEKADLIESIALIETALSHILNAEGEKLQKVIATTDDIKLILCTNAEVNKTLIYATHLEHVLYDKLTEVLHCKDFCDD